MSACPKGGEHVYRKTLEKDGWIEHTCRKCGDVIRRRQGNPKNRRSHPVKRAIAVTAAVLGTLAATAVTAAPASAGCVYVHQVSCR